MLAHAFGALREREFRLLWLGQLLSNAGTSLLLVALTKAVLDLGSAPAYDLSIVLAALVVPNLALALVGGVWADRLPRQRVMLGSDLVRGTAQTCAAMLLVSGRAQLWHLIAFAAAYGAANAFFGPAANGIVPETVSPERLQQANALMTVSRQATSVGGPVISAGLVLALGPGWVYGIDGISFFASAVFLYAMTPTKKAEVRQRFVRELVRGWREVRSRTWVWASILYFNVWNLAFAPFYVLAPVMVKRDLGGAAWGVLLTSTAIGYIIGGAIAFRFRPPRPLFVGNLLIATYALPLALLAYGLPVPVVALSACAGAATLEIANTLWYTTLQRGIPRETLSRVLSYDSLGSLLFTPVGYMLAAPLAELIGERATLLFAASALWLTAVIVAAVPSIRNVRAIEPATEAPTGLEQAV